VTAGRPTLERRIVAALDATPSRVPVILGGCGSGRTRLLSGMADTIGHDRTQYVDIERAASTPEGLYAALTRRSPYAVRGAAAADNIHNARGAFDALIAFLHTARAEDGQAAVFLIDEILELRMFESFPGLRGIVRETMDAIATSPNRFVLSTRYVTRAHRLLRDAPERFDVVHVSPLTTNEVSETLSHFHLGRDDAERSDMARMIHTLTDGRPSYVQSVANVLAVMDGASRGDPVSALAAALAVDGHLCLVCRFSFELRLHRARGYSALKAILHILAEDEPLTLTLIAQRLGRTPGSTKDYLTWLEDVDLVGVRQKRYSFVDPMLRLWVRIHCQPAPPAQADLSREVQEYAVSRLSYLDTPPTVQALTPEPPARPHQETVPDAEEKAWSIIEID